MEEARNVRRLGQCSEGGGGGRRIAAGEKNAVAGIVQEEKGKRRGQQANEGNFERKRDILRH